MRHIGALRFFYCGKGDTILLQASPADGGPDEWALVDCHLTRVSGAHWRIRDLFEGEKVQKLKFVCLTHPDRDHYWGMCQLLREHFYHDKKDRLRVDEFWDSGVQFTMLSAIAERLRTKPIKAELDELYRDFLTKPILTGKLGYRSMKQGRLATMSLGDFDLLSLSPNDNRVAHFNQQGLDGILGAPVNDVESSREHSNDLSVVLVLMHKTLPVNIILGGDATADTWAEALDTWQRLLKKLRRAKSRFAGVKVSHHGAKSSLHADLYNKYCWKQQTIAILTVGPGDDDHPHQDVLDLLAQRNIRTYRTCWPTGGAQPAKSSLPLPGSKTPQPANRAPRLDGYDWADIEVRITPKGRLSVRMRQG